MACMSTTTFLIILLIAGFDMMDPTFAFYHSRSMSILGRNPFVTHHLSIVIHPVASSSNDDSKALYMGLDVRIRIVGRKNGCERWLADAYDMYETWLQSSNISVETTWHKNNDDLIKAVKVDSSKEHSIILLDIGGTSMTSEEFSKAFYQWLNVGGSRVVFIIGGAEGLPFELKQEYPPSQRMSLSSMTFTHQFARTMLVEQIYRASEIIKGSNYHK